MREQAIKQELIEHYEQARVDGLCHAGAWEVALSKLKDNTPIDDKMLKKLAMFLHQTLGSS